MTQGIRFIWVAMLKSSAVSFDKMDEFTCLKLVAIIMARKMKHSIVFMAFEWYMVRKWPKNYKSLRLRNKEIAWEFWNMCCVTILPVLFAIDCEYDLIFVGIFHLLPFTIEYIVCYDVVFAEKFRQFQHSNITYFFVSNLSS